MREVEKGKERANCISYCDLVTRRAVDRLLSEFIERKGRKGEAREEEEGREKGRGCYSAAAYECVFRTRVARSVLRLRKEREE